MPKSTNAANRVSNTQSQIAPQAADVISDATLPAHFAHNHNPILDKALFRLVQTAALRREVHALTESVFDSDREEILVALSVIQRQSDDSFGAGKTLDLILKDRRVGGDLTKLESPIKVGLALALHGDFGRARECMDSLVTHPSKSEQLGKIYMLQILSTQGPERLKIAKEALKFAKEEGKSSLELESKILWSIGKAFLALNAFDAAKGCAEKMAIPEIRDRWSAELAFGLAASGKLEEAFQSASHLSELPKMVALFRVVAKIGVKERGNKDVRDILDKLYHNINDPSPTITASIGFTLLSLEDFNLGRRYIERALDSRQYNFETATFRGDVPIIQAEAGDVAGAVLTAKRLYGQENSLVSSYKRWANRTTPQPMFSRAMLGIASAQLAVRDHLGAYSTLRKAGLIASLSREEKKLLIEPQSSKQASALLWKKISHSSHGLISLIGELCEKYTKASLEFLSGDPVTVLRQRPENEVLEVLGTNEDWPLALTRRVFALQSKASTALPKKKIEALTETTVNALNNTDNSHVDVLRAMGALADWQAVSKILNHLKSLENSKLLASVRYEFIKFGGPHTDTIKDHLTSQIREELSEALSNPSTERTFIRSLFRSLVELGTKGAKDLILERAQIELDKVRSGGNQNALGVVLGALSNLNSPRANDLILGAIASEILDLRLVRYLILKLIKNEFFTFELKDWLKRWENDSKSKTERENRNDALLDVKLLVKLIAKGILPSSDVLFNFLTDKPKPVATNVRAHAIPDAIEFELEPGIVFPEQEPDLDLDDALPNLEEAGIVPGINEGPLIPLVFQADIRSTMDSRLVPGYNFRTRLNPERLAQVEKKIEDLARYKDDFEHTTTGSAMLKLLAESNEMAFAYYCLNNGKTRFSLINNYTFEQFYHVIMRAASLQLHRQPLCTFSEALDAAGLGVSERSNVLENLIDGRHPFYSAREPELQSTIRLDVSNNQKIHSANLEAGMVIGKKQLGACLKIPLYRQYLMEEAKARETSEASTLLVTLNAASTLFFKELALDAIEEAYPHYIQRVLRELEGPWTRLNEKLVFGTTLESILRNESNPMQCETLIAHIEEARVLLKRTKEEHILALKGENPRIKALGDEIRRKERALSGFLKGLLKNPSLQSKIDEISTELDRKKEERKALGLSFVSERYAHLDPAARKELLKEESLKLKKLVEKNPAAIFICLVLETVGEDRLTEDDTELIKEIASHLEHPLQIVSDIAKLDSMGRKAKQEKKVSIKYLDKKEDLMTLVRFADSKICCFSTSNYQMNVAHNTGNMHWIAAIIRDPLSFVFEIQETKVQGQPYRNNLGFVFGMFGVSDDGKPAVFLNGVYLSTGNDSTSTLSVLNAIENLLSNRLGAEYQYAATFYGGSLGAGSLEGYSREKFEGTRLRALKGLGGSPETRTYDDMGTTVNKRSSFAGIRKSLRDAPH